MRSGAKSRPAGSKVALQTAGVLLRFEPKLIVAACNTASALAMRDLEQALPVPVIGALNGHCMGGGVHAAVVCDTLIAVPGVRFMIPAARFGFVYVPASIRRIAAALGPSRAA